MFGVVEDQDLMDQEGREVVLVPKGCSEWGCCHAGARERRVAVEWGSSVEFAMLGI